MGYLATHETFTGGLCMISLMSFFRTYTIQYGITYFLEIYVTFHPF
jgi:hypothetical protein